jgi:hypothetical protein
LAEPISAKTGIGCARRAAASKSALPPRKEPVKPIAWIAGCVTSAWPTAGDGPCSSEDRPAGELRRPGMRGVRLHDDRAAGGQRGDRVAAGDREREREVGGAEDRDRAERHQHPPQVGPWHGLALGLRAVEPRVDPRALLDQRREEARLVRGARPLALEPGARERRLGLGALEERVAEGDQALGDRAEEGGAP